MVFLKCIFWLSLHVTSRTISPKCQIHFPDAFTCNLNDFISFKGVHANAVLLRDWVASTELGITIMYFELEFFPSVHCLANPVLIMCNQH